jgi:hypothetical protein
MALITEPTNLDYLITPLRLHINDNTVPYTHSGEELRTRLVYAVKALANRWNNRYLINNDTNYIERNPHTTFLLANPPLIQYSDERAIILQAAIDIQKASVRTSAAAAVSWKDDEVSYSNLSSVKFLQESLARDIEELDSLLPVSKNRLAQPRKQSLPGFDLPINDYEG